MRHDSIFCPIRAGARYGIITWAGAMAGFGCQSTDDVGLSANLSLELPRALRGPDSAHETNTSTPGAGDIIRRFADLKVRLRLPDVN